MRANRQMLVPRPKQQVALGAFTQVFRAHDPYHAQIILERLGTLRWLFFFFLVDEDDWGFVRVVKERVLALFEVLFHARGREGYRESVEWLLLFKRQLIVVRSIVCMSLHSGQIERLSAAFVINLVVR